MKNKLIIYSFFLIITMNLLSSESNLEDSETLVKIGVLALRGKDEALRKWTPTAEYLTVQIPGHTFFIVPLDFKEIFQTVNNKKIDFIIANSAIYIEMEKDNKIDRIATLKNICLDKTCDQFGGIIFTRSNRNDINKLNDLKGKSFMGVHENSFGGWRMAQREFKDLGINPYKNFSVLKFGGTHDEVVYAVLEGKVDAGTVRTGILEKMNEEGKINIKDFTILNQRQENSFPLLLSTRLYPEWPFARLAHTSSQLARDVSIALLSINAESPEAKSAEISGWTIPRNYQSVHECFKELCVPPYIAFGQIILTDFIQQYFYYILLVLVGFIILIAVMIYVNHLNHKLKLSAIELKAADLQKSQFLANMSHELRTPLNSILVLSRVLIMQAKNKLTKEENNYLKIVERNGKQLLSLINDILDLSKIDAGKMDVSLIPLSLNAMLGDIKDSLMPIAKEKGLDLNITISDNLPIIESDQMKVHQVLQNVISNALKFTEKGNVNIDVNFDSQNVYIDIKDTGIGIPKEELPHIFDEFRQVDGAASREYEGTGLGLAIANKMIKILGGNIDVKSKLGESSTFTITFPIKWHGESIHLEIQTFQPVISEMEEKYILVVDDNPKIVEDISEYLNKKGYKTIGATSGKEALELAKKHFREINRILDSLGKK